MKIIFDRSFIKSLDKLKEPSIKAKVEDLIYSVENAASLKAISGIKKLT